MTSKPTTIAKIWKTVAGYKAAILFTRQKFYCGYVAVGKDHPLFECHYGTNSPYLKDITEEEGLGERSAITALLANGRETSPEVAFDVHGSITFSGFWNNPEPAFAELNDGNWWFGYDCAHFGDGEFPDTDSEGNIVYNPYAHTTDSPKSLEFCIEQCESLARQIRDKTLPRNLLEHKPNG